MMPQKMTAAGCMRVLDRRERPRGGRPAAQERRASPECGPEARCRHSEDDGACDRAGVGWLGDSPGTTGRGTTIELPQVEEPG